jgi:hypothetical protein
MAGSSPAKTVLSNGKPNGDLAGNGWLAQRNGL